MAFFDKVKSKAELEFDKIITDLKTQLEIPYEKIQSEEYKKRIDSTEHKELFKNLIRLLQSRSDIKKNLLEDSAYRLPKKDFVELPRTVQILKKEDGSFMTIIEAKSKLAGGGKDPEKAQQPYGTFKKAKPAFIVPPTASNKSLQKTMGDEDYNYVSLTSNMTKLEQTKTVRSISQYQEMIRRESSLSHETKATVKLEYVFYYNDQKDTAKSSCYAKKGIELQTYLKNDTLYNKLSEEHKKQIFYSLLKEINALHSAGIIHQDIKPENIIVYYNSDQDTYEAKLTDLGVCSKICPKTARAAAGYESPEMFAANFYETSYIEPQKQLGKFTTVASHLANKHSEKLSDTSPHTKNDMWAIGLIYLFLMYNRTLSFKPYRINSNIFNNNVKDIFEKNDQWINGLLNPNREKRMSSQEAVLNLGIPTNRTIHSLFSEIKSTTQEPKTQPANKEDFIDTIKSKFLKLFTKRAA